MSAPVQIVALLLGVIELVLRFVIVAFLCCTVVGLLFVNDYVGELLTPYLWRAAMRISA